MGKETKRKFGVKRLNANYHLDIRCKECGERAGEHHDDECPRDTEARYQAEDADREMGIEHY